MCLSPLVAVKVSSQLDFKHGSVVDKNEIKIKKVPLDYDLKSFLNLYPEGTTFLIPCGHCEECLLAYRKEWSVRCVAESLYHQKNCFVTLTYDEEHHPDFDKKDFIRFIKDLRQDGIKVRYFACYEQGSINHRNHFHACLFGYMPEDLKYHSRSSSGEAMFISKYLSEKWNKGFVMVQDFNQRTAGYVSGYVSKKLGIEGSLFMSTHPGIGYQFYQDHKYSIYKFDRMFLNVSKHGDKVPRYYMKLLEKDGFDLTPILEERIKKSVSKSYEKARAHGFEFIDQNYKYDRIFAETKFSKLRRSL